jgi:hypothetical protein
MRRGISLLVVIVAMASIGCEKPIREVRLDRIPVDKASTIHLGCPS